ncbi:ABC transporter ATP-binding protein [Aquamicrobium lusatiense]|uniref:ABC transporter ATP-binding protein n=1 Tax=Aquamicrobium lusatiense TaxID=89772 RepID=UPI0024543589|nr:ABC transporter ATP-binding protein [Aquamicrobium lusatiense]MDH4989719.1 ABC transporter ATP-binding protein [Aquamicrobium lusatiense]
MPLLELDNFVSGYGDAVVIDGMNLAINEHEGLSVLGRNGVGKTTLMLSIMGHARHVGGSLRWNGDDLGHVPAYRRARLGLGWVPQERDIFPSLTVEENLLVAGRSGRFDLEAIYRLFPRLRQRKSNMGGKLSGGEQQMLAIGRTLMTNPKLLLLDEPFEGLAPVIVEELEETLQRLRREEGFATIIVEQRAEDALRLSDRAIVLDRGRVVLEGSSQELLADFGRVQEWIAV